MTTKMAMTLPPSSLSTSSKAKVSSISHMDDSITHLSVFVFCLSLSNVVMRWTAS